MRSGQSFFVKSIFVWNLLRNSQEQFFFFFENGNFEKIEKQNDERPFEKINRNSGNKFLEVLNKWFFCQEKKSIYLVRKNTIEKTNEKKVRNNKGDRTKTVLQEGMNK